MRVVLVLDHAHINGGQAKVAIESALGLSGRGHPVTVFAAVGPVDPRLAAAGIEVVCLGQPDIDQARGAGAKLAFAAQVMWNRRAEAVLGRLLAACPRDETVVHVHAFAKALSPSVFRAVAASGLPALYTMHEFFLVCPNGGFYDYQRGEICRRRPMSAACVTTNCDMRSYPRKAMRVARHALLDHVARWPDAVRDVAVISDLQAEVSRPYLKGARLHRLDNPISAPDLGPKPTDAPLGPALFVGRLSTEKGVGLFAEAARLAGLRPVIVGDGPDADAIRSRYPEAELVGWRGPDEVRALMRRARALVFPSIWYEGQPLTVYEALAVGTPVVVSDACAGREAVADGQTGFWFRSGDAADLAAKLTALQDDGLARAMARAAHARYWADPLTLDRHLDRLVALYAGLRREHPAAASGPVPAVEAALAG